VNELDLNSAVNSDLGLLVGYGMIISDTESERMHNIIYLQKNEFSKKKFLVENSTICPSEDF